MHDYFTKLCQELKNDNSQEMAEARFMFPHWEESAGIDFGILAISPVTAALLADAAAYFAKHASKGMESVSLKPDIMSGLVLAGQSAVQGDDIWQQVPTEGDMLPSFQSVTKNALRDELFELDLFAPQSNFAKVSLYPDGSINFFVLGLEEGENSLTVHNPELLAEKVREACKSAPSPGL